MIYHPEKSVILGEIPESCVVHAPVWIGKDVKIGKLIRIEAFAFICDWVTIEDEVFIGPHVCFTNDKRPPSFGKYWDKTLVKQKASIGAGAVILPGLTIGENAIIGAGSVVTCDIPANEVWVGNPARFLRHV